MDQSKKKTCCGKALRKLWRWIKVNVFCGLGVENAGERFVKASDADYVKFIKAEYWQFNETNWIYFMFLNPAVVATCFFGGYQIVFLDVIIIYLVSQSNQS